MIPLFYPYIPKESIEEVTDTLNSRWIGQAHKVDLFEKQFKEKFNQKYCVSVNSGTSALETIYDLLDLKEGDEVISTVFTCTATNLPLLARKVKIIWADIKEDTMNIDFDDVRKKITNKTKAIINVHIGGIKSEIPEDIKIPVVSDAAQAIGIFNGTFTCNSFQAIKHFTTGDGGMIVCPNEETYKKAKLMRWFGIDRDKKIANNWQCYKERQMIFDVDSIGYKRHMNDISAGMGIVGLKHYDEIIKYRENLFNIYRKELNGLDGIKLIDGKINTYWLCTVLVKKREDFAKKLFEAGVETNLVHLRNDVYKIFGGKIKLSIMDKLEDKYICLPLNMKITSEEVKYICNIIKTGW